jgi:hypothetical protein
MVSILRTSLRWHGTGTNLFAKWYRCTIGVNSPNIYRRICGLTVLGSKPAALTVSDRLKLNMPSSVDDKSDKILVSDSVCHAPMYYFASPDHPASKINKKSGDLVSHENLSCYVCRRVTGETPERRHPADGSVVGIETRSSSKAFPSGETVLDDYLEDTDPPAGAEEFVTLICTRC